MKKVETFLSDRAINTKNEDKLNRTEFAQNLAKAILKYTNKDNLVIGLYGKWGTGKSSILNLFSECMEKIKIRNKPIIVRFNPWNFSDQNQLLEQFFNTLSLTLKRRDKSKKMAKISHNIEMYSRIFTPLKLIPGIGNSFQSMEEISTAISDTLKKASESLEKDLIETKKEITELLSTLKNKIIIIIDDIDRLSNIEIKMIFQLVKSIADFSNTIYILAFDKNVIEDTLSKLQEGDGNKYLEKIIQVPFEIPDLPSEKIYDLLFAELGEIGIANSTSWNSVYWGNIFHSGIKYYFKTIRDVNRFVNIFKFYYQFLKDETNPVDLIAITILQIFDSKIFEDIRNNKSKYIGSSDSYLNRNIGKSNSEKHIDEAISKSNLNNELIQDLLKTLFPKLETFYGLTHMNYGYEWLKQWEKENRICSPAKIDIYFSLTIDNDNISNNEVSNILNWYKSTDELCTELKKIRTIKKFKRLLERIQLFTEKDIEINRIESILKALNEVGDLYIEHNSEYFDNSPAQISNINYQLISRLKSEERFDIVENIIEYLSESIYPLTFFLNFESTENKGVDDNENRSLFTADELLKLNDKLKNKIVAFIKAKKLLSHPYLENILLWLYDKTEIEEIKILYKNNLNNYKMISNFISGFKRTTRSQSSGDYVYRYTKYYNIDTMKKLIDFEWLEDKVRNFINSEEFIELSSDQIYNIKLLLDCIDGKVKYPN